METTQLQLFCNQLQQRTEDIRPSDLLGFPDPVRSVLNYAVRRGEISLSDLASRLEVPPAQARLLADLLVARHLFHPGDMKDANDTWYDIRMTTRSRPEARPPVSFWERLFGRRQK